VPTIYHRSRILMLNGFYDLRKLGSDNWAAVMAHRCLPRRRTVP